MATLKCFCRSSDSITSSISVISTLSLLLSGFYLFTWVMIHYCPFYQFALFGYGDSYIPLFQITYGFHDLNAPRHFIYFLIGLASLSLFTSLFAFPLICCHSKATRCSKKLYACLQGLTCLITVAVVGLVAHHLTNIPKFPNPHPKYQVMLEEEWGTDWEMTLFVRYQRYYSGCVWKYLAVVLFMYAVLGAVHLLGFILATVYACRKDNEDEAFLHRRFYGEVGGLGNSSRLHQTSCTSTLMPGYLDNVSTVDSDEIAQMCVEIIAKSKNDAK